MSSLTVALFLIRLTRAANLHVLRLSSVCSFSGLIVATMMVLQLPPRESRNTDVIMLIGMRRRKEEKEEEGGKEGRIGREGGREGGREWREVRDSV